jgi:hypothetical protein
MKKKMKWAALVLVIVLGGSLRNNVSAQYYDEYYDRDRDVSYQDFYDELEPYGRWVEYPGHGYVWVPDAEPDFQPYSTRGHWIWTDDYEWMWVSDYDWGWAPFHYGRWDYDSYYGWYWVPGYEWSPAWVAWRDGGDYYGWAPIRPGINISINFNIGGYSPPYYFWCFAPRRYITSPRIYDYYVDRRMNVNIIHQTTIIVNNFRYSNSYGFRSGPRRYDAEVYCGRINPVRLRQTYVPGRTFYRNNEVNIYRPMVRRDDNRNFAPRNFERYNRNRGGYRNNNDNNGFHRDNNDFRRDNGINNHRPDDRDRVDINRSFERRDNYPGRSRDNNGGFRRDDDIRQPQDNSNSRPYDNRNGRFDRNENNVPNRQPMERRVERPDERRDRNFDPGYRQPDNNRFERQNDNNNPGHRDMRTSDNWRQHQPPSTERRKEHRPQPSQRNFEKRGDEGGSRFERNSSGQADGRTSGGSGNGNGRRSF